MKLLATNGKYIILGALVTILALFSVWSNSANSWNIVALIAYSLCFGFYLGQWLLPKEKRFWQTFFGTISLLCMQTILLSLVYWFYQIDKEVISVLLVAIPLLISLQRNKEIDIDVFTDIVKEFEFDSYVHVKSYLSTKLIAVLVFLGQMSLFSVLISRRFTDTLISPWTLFGPKFFLIFAITTMLLLWVLQKSKHNPSNLLLTSIHSLLVLSVALIVFKLGFGFDPFIHQATEAWIAKHNAILPKNPYYIGQYMLVVFSHLVSHVSTEAIDKIIVPIGAGIIVPLITYFSFSRTGFKRKVFPAILLIPLLPLVFFTFTTPNNLALLLAYIVFTWMWYESRNATKKSWIIPSLLILATCSIHPFVGLPLLVVYAGYKLLVPLKGKIRTLSHILYGTILTLIIPFAFFINSVRLGEKIGIQNPFANIQTFLLLFKRPHWVWLHKGTLDWQLLYIYRDFIKLLFVILIIVGIVVVIRRYRKQSPSFYITTSISLFISSFILSTAIKFPNVISYEQNVYANRVLEMIMILLVPFLVVTLREVFLRASKKPVIQTSLAIFFSFLLLISWYFTYPTRDPVSFHTGHTVRQADINAIHFIDHRNNNIKDYIVLSNQKVAAAALREFGFVKYFDTPAGKHYFYSIPTGGPLYQFFRKMVYEKPKKEWMEQAMRYVGVKKAYFIHTSYWAPAAEIRDNAKMEANNWWELGDSRVWVYEYLLED